MRALRRWFVMCALCLLWAGQAEARVDGYPYLDNETIGLFRNVAAAVQGPPDVWDEVHWQKALLDGLAEGGDVMAPLRYIIAFSAYSVAQAAALVPAYPGPYQVALEGFVDRMLQPAAWQDWLTVWGGTTPLGPDNIMWTGHLSLMMALYRHRFGDDRYESPVAFGLPGGPSFETDAHSLADWLAAQADGAKDGAGDPTWSIPCEPGRIFVPCNTPHRVAQRLFDRQWGTAYAASDATWLAWVREQMLDPPTQVLHDLYWPFGRWEPVDGGKPPEVEPRLSGIYNGWSIWFIDALDPDWAAALYTAYLAHFVVTEGPTPFGDDVTMVADRSGTTGLVGYALDVGATGFGMVLAREMGDTPLADALVATWRALFGDPAWIDDGVRFTFAMPGFPQVIQNAFPLLQRTTLPTTNLRTLVSEPFDPSAFQAPRVVSVDNPAAFVNQAVWDAVQQRLILTLSGGAATTATATIAVTGIAPDASLVVTEDGAPFQGWTRDGDLIRLVTRPLGPGEVSYILAPGPPAPPPESDPEVAAAPEAVEPAPAAEPAGAPDAATPDASEADATGPDAAVDVFPTASVATSDGSDGGCAASSRRNSGNAPLVVLGMLALALVLGRARPRAS